MYRRTQFHNYEPRARADAALEPARTVATSTPTARSALRGNRGVTIIELLAVVAVIGVLTGIGAFSLRPSPARLAANAVQAIVQQARFESIKTNRPMVVSIDAVARTVSVTSATNAATVACTGATPVRTVLFSEAGRVTVLADDFSIVWLPSGQPRMCNGSPVSLAGVGVGLTDGYRSVSVNVGAGGEVVVQ